jgi:hypothetical protein
MGPHAAGPVRSFESWSGLAWPEATGLLAGPRPVDLVSSRGLWTPSVVEVAGLMECSGFVTSAHVALGCVIM